ncbi:ribosome recycling factor [bacterium]|nr:ribosome recycling factor [bacterium]
MSQYIDSFTGDFGKKINHFEEELEKLRVGRATPLLVEGVLVESYGVKTPLKQVASISVPEPSMLAIEPWDKNLLKEIEKAIVGANLDLSVSIYENIVRVNIPPLTEEKRKQVIKILHEKKEDAKVSLRQSRDKIRKEIEHQEKDGEISEDDKFTYQKELDDLIKERTDQIEKISKKKEVEIMKI